MTGTFTRGLLAGAAGTTALNAASWLDMAVRGRSASDLPARTTDALADAAGWSIPGRGSERESRRTALGALTGIANGLALGVVSSAVRSAGVRLSFPVGTVVKGAASSAATNLPVAALGVSDPRSWSRQDWLSDALPHLAYGATVQAVVSGLPTPRERALPRQKARAGLVGRSLLLGVAAGGRSSLGVAGPTLTAQDTGVVKKLASLAAVAGEVYGDKQPGVPARTSPQVLPGRLVSGAGGGALLARRAGANAALPSTAGALGALAGSYGGLAWRRWAGSFMPDWQAAVVEDAAAVLLSLTACLPGRRRSTRVTRVYHPPRA
ncbi:hypothetical protein [Modestobacter roseus]|uniref:Putative membrane protein n=1 Tax=Modestobacter roseus TaxID=1181884 RepID=A0A562IS37_9ACTN|nr:hypothetical protein [Modestobacter roseus]MQA35306.1 hypothetical protein [Modestobacter roseus]TWH73545.1 putative membrane protein [Modestobacter roseus]